MNEHLNIVEWRGLLLHELEIAERARVLRHIAECPSCEKLYETARSLKGALKGMRKAASSASPYLAVASPDQPDAEDESGMFSVCVISDENGTRFDSDSQEADGAGEKYAMNFEDDLKTLSDDGGLLDLRLTDNAVSIRYADEDAAAFVRIGGSAGEWTALDEETAFPLPAGAQIRVELLFI